MTMHYQQWRQEVETLLRQEFGFSIYADCEEAFKEAYRLGRTPRQVVDILLDTARKVRNAWTQLN